MDEEEFYTAVVVRGSVQCAQLILPQYITRDSTKWFKTEDDLKWKLKALDQISKNSLLFDAWKVSKMEMVKWLLSQGLRLNATNIKGDTLLHMNQPSKENVKWYIQELGEHFDIHQYNNEGFTPLHKACEYGDLPLVKFLVKKKADVNFQVEQRETPLSLACKSNKVEVVNYLLQHNADPNLVDAAGNTSLHKACEYDTSIDVVRTLLKHKAEVKYNFQNKLPSELSKNNEVRKLVEGTLSPSSQHLFTFII